MRYQIVYMKSTPMTTWAADWEQMRRLVEQLRSVGYSVDVWQYTSFGSRKVDI